MNCPICEDTGKVALTAPAVVEVDGLIVRLSRWRPCPACPAGVRAEVEVSDIVRRLWELTFGIKPGEG